MWECFTHTHTHTHRCLYLQCEGSQGVGLLHKSPHTLWQTHTCQMEIYIFLWLILSLDKYSQGVSQLHINLCKTHKQNTHVQHSYTHRTVKHPRPEGFSSPVVIPILITISAQGLTHSTTTHLLDWVKSKRTLFSVSLKIWWNWNTHTLLMWKQNNLNNLKS